MEDVSQEMSPEIGWNECSDQLLDGTIVSVNRNRSASPNEKRATDQTLVNELFKVHHFNLVPAAAAGALSLLGAHPNRIPSAERQLGREVDGVGAAPHVLFPGSRSRSRSRSPRRWVRC
jgi:hypothetical protein